MKLESDIFNVEAKKEPPVITEPVGVMTMPLGFIRKTEPVDFKRPAMEEILGPTTLFKVAPPALLMNTSPLAPIEKPCQFITALGVDWVIVIRPEAELIPPVP